MSIVNSAVAQYPGFGSPTVVKSSVNNALSGTVQQTTTISNLSPTTTRGMVRAKVYSLGGTTPAVSGLSIQVSDGTTPYIIESKAAGATSTNMDILTNFQVDINVTSVSVLTTLTGTSPTATLDIEYLAGP